MDRVCLEKANSLYLFETASGRLVRRVGGLPQVINRLAWSPDGCYLAVGLAGANGIRLFATDDWREVGKDDNYTGPIYGLSFDQTGRLAVAAFDGYLRVYDAELRPVAKAKAPSGTRPYAVALTPDGGALAVGYNDALAVDILSVPDLRRVGAANVAGLSGGSLSQVAWSRDGALLAGGSYWSAATGSPVFSLGRQPLEQADDASGRRRDGHGDRAVDRGRFCLCHGRPELRAL